MTRPSPIMDRVLQIITAAPGLTVAQIAERAGVTGNQVSNALFKLHTRHGEAYRLSVPGARASVWFNTRRQADRFRDSRFPDKPQRAEASPGQQVSMTDRVLDVVTDRERFMSQAVEHDDGGWTKHTEDHWSRTVGGKRLDYWPSRKKWQYEGNIRRGDVWAFIRRKI